MEHIFSASPSLRFSGFSLSIVRSGHGEWEESVHGCPLPNYNLFVLSNWVSDHCFWANESCQGYRQKDNRQARVLKFSNTRLKQNWPYPNRSKFLTNRLPKNLECFFSERNSSLVLNFSNIPRLSLRAMTAGQTTKWNWNNRARKLPCVFGLLAPHLKPAGKVKYNFFRGWCQSLL